MAYYDKKVIYLAEMEYGNKIKGAGFVRMECRGKSCSFDMHVSGMKTLAEKKYDICVMSAEGQEYPVGRIFIHNGNGDWKETYDEDKMGISCQEIAEIQVKLSDTKMLTGKMPFQKAMQAAEMKVQSAGGNGETAVKDIGESRGIWKFVRGGNRQENVEGKRGVQESQKEMGERQNGLIKENSVFQRIKGGGERENIYGMEEREQRDIDREILQNKSSRAMAEDRSENDRTGIRGETNAGLERTWNNGDEQKGTSRENGGSMLQRGSKDTNVLETEGRSGIDGKWTGSSREAQSEIDGKGATGKKSSGTVDRKQGIGKEPEGTEYKFGWGMPKRSAGKEKEKKREVEGDVQIEDVILNDKWEQLKQIYSVVHPYEDERQYIAIQPKDFVIMTGDYQHLANNSFLLHGFYNYRHIVLGKEQDGYFYLGVPGVYYEREKMVALMFGFEAFECDGGKAEAGKFGYYLRKVKI